MPAFRVGKPRFKGQVDTPIHVASNVAVLSPVPLDLVVYEDPIGQWSPVDNTLTILKRGLYLLTVGLEAANTTSSATLVFLFLDSTVGSLIAKPLYISGVSPSQADVASWQGELDAGVEIYITAFLIASSGEWDVYGPTTQLALSRIGPDRWT